MTKMAAMPKYGKTLQKIFFSGTCLQISTNLYINHDPVMILTYLRVWSTWVAYAFEWVKLLECHFKGKLAGK